VGDGGGGSSFASRRFLMKQGCDLDTAAMRQCRVEVAVLSDCGGGEQ